MSEHTQGKLIAERIPATFNPKMDGLQLVGATPDGIDLMTVALCTVNEADEANARRLVACWNAFDMMRINDIEELAEIGQGVIRLTVLANEYRGQRDDLLAVLKSMKKKLRIDDQLDMYDTICAAIAKAEAP